MKMPKTGLLLRIEWNDATSTGNWALPEDVTNAPVLVESVGWKIKEDRLTITLAQSRAANGRVADTISIPKVCVVKRRRLV